MISRNYKLNNLRINTKRIIILSCKLKIKYEHKNKKFKNIKPIGTTK